jgi:dTDP-4-amino-4,6-dideoxygalactose transaminase
MNNIPFNKPYLTGKETDYIIQAVNSGKISGDGVFTEKCNDFFENIYGFKKVLLTTSCTDALEMAALLLDIKEGDEIIAPSFTFVSTVNAFVLRGAKIVFADSNSENPNINAEIIENLITPRTKAIIPVHYAGIACDMTKIMEIARKYNLFVIEDAAQAIDSYYREKRLGSLGHMSAFSFHETKNIISGEGGMLVINDERFVNRAEIIREKGTNRSAFFRGEVDKYGWVDLGSSFLPSDIIAAFLYAQIENIDLIQNKRKKIWQLYMDKLAPLISIGVRLPYLPDFASNNGHIFYLLCRNLEERSGLIQYLKNNKIHSVFHYVSLHKSSYYHNKYNSDNLQNSDCYTNTLLRLPIYYELSIEQVDFISSKVLEFYKINK